VKKEKFHIEYVFDKVSIRSLWNHLSTAMGLSSWFADQVIIKDNIYTFYWNKVREDARMITFKPENVIRYLWLNNEEDSGSYLEFRIHTIELTGSKALEITDFASPDEKADAIALWDTQVEVLKRTLGI
jgi:hypothetical protein